MQKLKPLFWALCCTGLATPAWAGLSPLRVLSQPGQPFEAELTIVDEPLPDSAHVELADRNRYGELAPYSPSADSLHFTLMKKLDSGQYEVKVQGPAHFTLTKKPGSEQYVVRVQGPAHFAEPELRFAVQVSWAEGRLVREYRVNPLQGVPPVPPVRDEQPAKKAMPSAKPGLTMPPMLLGDIKLLSRIGEPLRAEVEVRGHGLHRGELSARVEWRGGTTERTETVQVEVLARGGRHAVLGLSSQASINEPILRFRLLVSHGEDDAAKAYTLLLDPEKQAVAGIENGHASEEEPPGVIEQPHSSYRVRPGDTLSGIARQLDGAKRPIDGVMRQLVRENPAAFVRANPNRMRAGRLLRYPAAWGELKGMGHVSVLAPRPEPEHPATTVSEAAAPAAPSSPANMRRIELEHKLQQQDKQLQQLEGKANEIEQQLKAKAQALKGKKVLEAKSVQETAPAAKKTQEKPGGHEAQAAPKSPEPARPMKLKELPPEPHPRDHSQELKTGAAAGLLLTSLGGMAWLYHRRRQHQAEQGLLPQEELALEELLPPPPAAPAMEAGAAAMQRDWMEQAEIHQASGHYRQAVEVLRAGIAAAPNREDLRFSLLQLLARLQDFPGVLEEARVCLERFGVESELGRRVLQWGRIVMPTAPLFAERGEPAEPEEILLIPEMGRADTAASGKPPAAAPGSLWEQHAKEVASPPQG